MRSILILSTAVCGALALTACTSPSPSTPDAEAVTAAGSPAEVTSCGLDLEVAQAPTQAVTLEQGATEVLLALGLEDSMVGTSYLTDAVAPELSEAYASVPVLADQYPTAEQLRGVEPDFVYSMRASAFATDAVGPRAELLDLGVPAYLSANDCEDPSLVVGPADFDRIFTEVRDLAAIFGVPERAEELVTEQQAALDEVTASASEVGSLDVVWIYSTINGAPIVAGSTGLPQTLTDLAGATNAFDDLDAQWSETTWDEIAQRDPGVVVLADLSRGLPGDSAEEKADHLREDPVASLLSAVQADQLVPIPATEMDPSVRSIDALQTLSAALVTFAAEESA
ncbi:ABC transporter substrate-binding protein [Actinotalea sp. BY-33]|uniref:ABC transporter substrate-binding protein n=1 Tax=Actinotalea soli TaxID=2819234 RepID=A0A939RUI9_9CELL|nr:ABC transporter substrate-binding protein [Actinotalea soli]MBO1752709.1 ABC transporter substrate-binding protein [Actinotalea soli]